MTRYTISLLIMLATALGVVGQVPVDSVQTDSAKYSTFDPVELRISSTFPSVPSPSAVRIFGVPSSYPIECGSIVDPVLVPRISSTFYSVPYPSTLHETLVKTRISRTFFSVGMIANAGNSELAPYYISSNNGGNITQQYSALMNASLFHSTDTVKRFAWGVGLEVWGGYASSAGYQRYKGDGQFEVQKQHPARVWVQQAYLIAKYRSIYAVAGQAYKSSPIVNSRLSSGDLVWSGNARPPVGLLAGFFDFQNIPFTQGWVQIKGEFGYFRELDDKWLENHYNYYNHFITTDRWLHYKSLHFRTNPNQPVVFSIGAQSACQFGGTAKYYKDGELDHTVKMDADAKAFFRTFIAGSGGNSAGDSFVEGNHLGTWDIALDYNLNHNKHLHAYTQWLWEDGSGIGKMNGFDGLWGLEYSNAVGLPLIEGVVIEYIDFTNQSGPIHWTPNDHEGTPITSHSSGADDYYNNYIYNGYQSRGMSIGSPFVKSPLYNHDGYMRYRDNVMRGFHVAMRGSLNPEWVYCLKGSYRKAWGTPIIPRAGSVDDFSIMAQVWFNPYRGCFNGPLSFTAAVAMDRGNLYGNNWGGMLGITYSGNFNFKKR